MYALILCVYVGFYFVCVRVTVFVFPSIPRLYLSTIVVPGPDMHVHPLPSRLHFHKLCEDLVVLEIIADLNIINRLPRLAPK